MKNSQTLKWIYKNSKKHIPAVIFLAVLSGLISVGYIVLSYISSFVIDIATKQRSGSITPFIVALFALILWQGILYIANSSIKVRTLGKLDMHLKGNMFSSLMRKEYSHIDKIHSGDILNRFTSDVEVVIMGIATIIPGAVGFIAKLSAALVIVTIYSYKITILVLIVGVIVGIAARIYSTYMKKIHKGVQESAGKTRSYMQECTENVIVVKVFNSIGNFGNKLNELMMKTVKLRIRRNMMSNISSVSMYFLFTGGYYVALAVGAFMINKGEITYGTLVALLGIISQIKGPITNISGIIPKYYSMLASAERIMELENLPKEETPMEMEETNKIYENLKAIEFQNINFSYDGTKDILVNSNMSIKKGEMVALIGGSGEGKSTIFRILLGLYKANSGEAYIDANEKYEIGSKIRSLFAYVPQGNLILSGTIAENIKFCKTDASEEEIVEAAKCADLYDFIMTLPQKFETVVGERGAGLSEGQIQRVAIARAILSGAPILLLDECSSALDEKTEKRVLENIKNKSDLTSIIITHRPAALNLCDSVYNLENGKLQKTE